MASDFSPGPPQDRFSPGLPHGRVVHDRASPLALPRSNAHAAPCPPPPQTASADLRNTPRPPGFPNDSARSVDGSRVFVSVRPQRRVTEVSGGDTPSSDPLRRYFVFG